MTSFLEKLKLVCKLSLPRNRSIFFSFNWSGKGMWLSDFSFVATILQKYSYRDRLSLDPFNITALFLTTLSIDDTQCFLQCRPNGIISEVYKRYTAGNPTS